MSGAPEGTIMDGEPMTTSDGNVPAPGTPCPRGCTLGWPSKEPELLTVNIDGEVSCPTCWECFGIVAGVKG